MSVELKKRIITSLFLITLLILVFYYSYILIISLIIISSISWIEFSSLISRIFIKNHLNHRIKRSLIKAFSLLYLLLFSILIFNQIFQSDFRIDMIYFFLICIMSDIGGLFFGKIFKGRKLTKISPNKTLSGSIGSFTLSMLLIPFFYYFFRLFDNLIILISITLIISFTCQLGDIFISYLKRKAKVKDTGDLLPGHGGFLDRFDGMLFALPLGILLRNFL